MKNVFYLLVIIVLVTGCSSLNSEGMEKSIEQKESDTIEKYLKENGLPLEGNHVFDPKIIKEGDIVAGFTLTDIEVTPATEQYPLDTVVASFSGEATIKGIIMRTLETDEFFPDVFTLNFSDDNDILPVSHHDSRNRWLIFDNSEQLKEQLDLKPGEEMEATIKIKDLNINYIPTETADTTTLIEVIEIEK